MRILVCGSRSFGKGRHHAGVLHAVLAPMVQGQKREDITIVHGGCIGADNLAGDWAHHWGYKEEVHVPDWIRFGKAAGPIRNSEMIHSDIDEVVAFWDGKSKGTADTIRKAERSYIGMSHVHVVEYK